MEGTKEIVTLISSSTHLILNDGSAATGATQYRSLTGGMQYLSLTRPDIAYTVNNLPNLGKHLLNHIGHLQSDYFVI